VTTRTPLALTLVIPAAAAGALACHKPAPAAPPEAGAEAAAPTAPADAAPEGPAPRCHAVHDAAGDGVTFGDGADVGDAVLLPDGMAAGLLRRQGKDRIASVVRVRAGSAEQIDLGIAWGDAPAPKPIARGADIFAVGYVKPMAGQATARTLSVFSVAANGTHLVDLRPETDPSSSFDATAAPAGAPVGAIVAWDDTAGAPPRGLVTVAALSANLRSVAAVHALRPSGDAGVDPPDLGDPRLAVRSSGYWLVWVARRPEHPTARLPVPTGELETPSEETSFSWLEAVPLDPQGAPVGVPRRLTSPTGHVGGYAIGSPGDGLVVVAEDDGPSGRGGGSLERVLWRGDGPPDLTWLVRASVEEDAPPLLIDAEGGGAWLSYRDLSGEANLLSLDPSGRPRAHTGASPEPLLDGARLIGTAGGKLALLSQDGPHWALRWATCTR
jgi:hypothetical protein